MTAKLVMAVDIFFRIIEILIFVRIILSWIRLKENALVVFVYSVTEPILAPIRNMISRSSFGKNMMFDFSPIIAYVLLGVIKQIIILIIARL